MMKGSNSYLYYIPLLLSGIIALISCAGPEIDIPEGQVKDYPVVLAADFSVADTRLSVSGTSIGWDKENDKIKIVAVAEDKSTGVSELSVFSLSDDNKTASFTGYVSMTSMPQYCCFMFPVHNSMTFNPEAEEISVPYNSQSGYHEPYLYAMTNYSESGISTEFLHIGSMLEITCNIEGVSQLTFAGNKLEKLSPVIVNTSTGKVSEPTEGNIKLTVPVREDKTYIAVPPINFENGFSIICSNEDGSSSMIKTFSTDGGLSSGYDFSSNVGQIIPIILEGQLENFSITASTATPGHTKTDKGLLTGTSVTFSMNKTGVSDKLVEEWGATLVNSEGQVVRKITYTNANPPAGQTVTMDVANGWKLLPEGTYTFTPYYKIYGQVFSLDSQSIGIPDPGVKLEISGQTSYDKYTAGDIDGANAHANTLISGVAVSTNVDLSILENYSATLDGVDMGLYTLTSDTELKATYGNLYKTAFQSYKMTASITVGNLEFTATKDFHLTGLPYVADFTTSNPTGWTPAWKTIKSSYKDGRVVFKTSSAIRSPGFYIPDEKGVKVKTACDSRHNVTSNSSTATMSISTCPSDQDDIVTGVSLDFGEDYYQAAGGFDKVEGFGSYGYLGCTNVFTLTKTNSAMMYSLSLGKSILGSNTFVSFKHKIEYSE